MAKPIRFELIFSGHQTARIDDDGAFIRPASAAEIAKALADELNYKLQNAGKKFRVTVKPLN